MRTYFKTTAVPKRMAKAVAHVFPALSLAKAQEWTARMCGYRNWHELDLFTRNYTGEPTPDPFLVEYQEEQEKYLRTLDSYEDEPAELKKRGERVNFQVTVLEELMSVHNEASFFPGDCYWEIMWLAHQGLSGLSHMDYGKGSPLFNALQYPWFKQENQARVVYEEGEYEDDLLHTHSIALLNGFASYNQLNRWAHGANKKYDKETLSDLRDEFPGFFKRVEGGSRVRLDRDSEGREVIVQSTMHRYWWRRDSDRRMVAGFTLTVVVVARREDSGGDEYQFCIHDTWYDKSITHEHRDNGYWPPPINEAAAMLRRFIRTRIGMDSMSGKISVAYDNKKGSREIAEHLRDVVYDLTREETDIDLDKCFEQKAVPYKPMYLTRGFSAFGSQLV